VRPGGELRGPHSRGKAVLLRKIDDTHPGLPTHLITACLGMISQRITVGFRQGRRRGGGRRHRRRRHSLPRTLPLPRLAFGRPAMERSSVLKNIFQVSPTRTTNAIGDLPALGNRQADAGFRVHRSPSSRENCDLSWPPLVKSEHPELARC